MKNPSVLRWLCRRMRHRIPGLLLLTFTSVLTALLGVWFALGTKNVINSAVSGTRSELIQAAIVQALIIIGILVCRALHQYVLHRLTAELDWDWKQKLTHKILRSDYAKISGYHSGELINRLNNDVRTVDDSVLNMLPSLSSMATRLIAVVAVLISMAPVFTLALVVAGVVVVLITASPIIHTYLAASFRKVRVIRSSI